MLTADRLVLGYAGAPVVRGVSLALAPGQVFALLGANGAGKSTIARALAGVLPVRDGSVTLDGVDVTAAPSNDRVRRGLSLVPEGRHLFGRSTVRDNILLGAYLRSRHERAESFDRVMELFPQLPRLLGKRAKDLSGGEQQMVAVGRALMADPKYLILDEPSLGLAPIYVDLILRQAGSLADDGVGVLLIEQNVAKALDVAHGAAVIENGIVSLDGSADELRSDPRVVDLYLGGVS